MRPLFILTGNLAALALIFLLNFDNFFVFFYYFQSHAGGLLFLAVLLFLNDKFRKADRSCYFIIYLNDIACSLHNCKKDA